MPRIWLVGLSTIAALLLPATSLAWSPAGHMVTGAMLHELLVQEDPAALTAMLELLRQHPHYTELLAPAADPGLPAGDRDGALLMRAARWADDVRAGPRQAYSEPTWHFVNFRYESGQLADPGDDEHRDGLLLWALDENVQRLSNDAPGERAVALTWLLHLIGDLHMPLHDISFVDAARPDGDRGGNLTFVRETERGRTVTLHWLWDGLLGNADDPASVRQRAAELLNRHGMQGAAQVDGAPLSDFRAWSKAGAHLAVSHAYGNGTLAAGSAEEGTLLPEDYLSQAREQAELQAVIASRRLARLLAERF